MKRLAIISSLILVTAGLVSFLIVNTPEQHNKKTVELVSKPCSPIAGTCTAEANGLRLSFSLPEKIEYLKQFDMKLETSGWQNGVIQKIDVEFSMVGMSMGQNRFVLKRIAGDPATQNYSGQAVLPVCVSGRVDWVADVRVITAAEIYTARFVFTVTKG